MSSEVTEAQIEKALGKEVKKCLGFCFKCKLIGWAGAPDRLCLLPVKRLYFIELKRPKGGVLSPLQIVFHKMLKVIGFPVYVIWTYDQLDEFVKEISL